MSSEHKTVWLGNPACRIHRGRLHVVVIYNLLAHITFCVFGLRFCKAYIPLRREKTSLRPSHWAIPLTQEFCVGDTNMLVSNNAKICVTPNTKAKISFPLVTQHKPSLQWNMGLRKCKRFCFGNNLGYFFLR